MLEILRKIGEILAIPEFVSNTLPYIKKSVDKYIQNKNKTKNECYGLISQLYGEIRREAKNDKIVEKELLGIFKTTIKLGEKNLYFKCPEDYKVSQIVNDGSPAGILGSFTELFQVITESDKVLITLNNKYNKKSYKKRLIKRIDKYLDYYQDEKHGDKNYENNTNN